MLTNILHPSLIELTSSNYHKIMKKHTYSTPTLEYKRGIYRIEILDEETINP